MHLQGHFGVNRQKPVVDGKVLLDIGKKKKSLHGGLESNTGRETRDVRPPASLLISENQLDKALSDLT